MALIGSKGEDSCLAGNKSICPTLSVVVVGSKLTDCIFLSTLISRSNLPSTVCVAIRLASLADHSVFQCDHVHRPSRSSTSSSEADDAASSKHESHRTHTLLANRTPLWIVSFSTTIFTSQVLSMRHANHAFIVLVFSVVL